MTELIFLLFLVSYLVVRHILASSPVSAPPPDLPRTDLNTNLNADLTQLSSALNRWGGSQPPVESPRHSSSSHPVA